MHERVLRAYVFMCSVGRLIEAYAIYNANWLVVYSYAQHIIQ